MRAAAELAAALAGTPEPTRIAMRLIANRAAVHRGRCGPWPVHLPAGCNVLAHLDALGDLSAWGAEQFGRAYAAMIDPAHRDTAGVYFTPEPVADALAYAALSPRLVDRDQVRVLDPACGAGVLLESAACILAGRDRDIPADLITGHLFGTDIDPVGVEIARTVLWLRSDGTLPLARLENNVVCADPLAGATPPALGEDPTSLVILGNPPYRDKAKGAAPWIEARRARGESLAGRPSLDEFRDPAQHRRAYALSSMAIFFWRWALWRAFEVHTGPAVITYITPSAFIKSPTYALMRQRIREHADQGWIIDLTPEHHQPPVSTRIFPGVQQPLCISVLTRTRTGSRFVPATVFYLAAEGERATKIATVRRACAHIATADLEAAS